MNMIDRLAWRFARWLVPQWWYRPVAARFIDFNGPVADQPAGRYVLLDDLERVAAVWQALPIVSVCKFIRSCEVTPEQQAWADAFVEAHPW